MSVSDMNAKRPAFLKLKRSSMSDVTDESSAFANDVSGSECDLKMPYSEIVAIAGVSDIPILHGQEIDEVPPAPSSVRRSKPAMAPKPKPKAIVSLVSPHKLLMLSQDFCELFGYSVESEICGRAVKILHGPRTDPGLLVSAIKNAAMASTTCTNVVLYHRDGNDIEVEIKFSPYMSGDGALAGCLMEVSPVSVTN
jgi:PAS domain S-box-containing protein